MAREDASEWDGRRVKWSAMVGCLGFRGFGRVGSRALMYFHGGLLAYRSVEAIVLYMGTGTPLTMLH